MVSKEEVKHIAKLARLGLSAKEVNSLKEDLSSILDYFGELNKLDVSGVNPTSHVVLTENIMREDEGEKKSSELASKLIKSAPHQKGNHIQVKPIL